MLAFGAVTAQHAVMVSRMARNLAENVVIYTNGSEQAAVSVQGKPGPRITVDSGKLARVEKAPERSDVIVHFEDGSSKTEGFLPHMPTPKLSTNFAEELGCELVHPGSIKVGVPFPETTVKGVYAAGDIATPAPAIMSALYSGQFAGVGIVQSLAADVTE